MFFYLCYLCSNVWCWCCFRCVCFVVVGWWYCGRGCVGWFLVCWWVYVWLLGNGVGVEFVVGWVGVGYGIGCWFIVVLGSCGCGCWGGWRLVGDCCFLVLIISWFVVVWICCSVYDGSVWVGFWYLLFCCVVRFCGILLKFLGSVVIVVFIVDCLCVWLLLCGRSWLFVVMFFCGWLCSSVSVCGLVLGRCSCGFFWGFLLGWCLLVGNRCGCSCGCWNGCFVLWLVMGWGYRGWFGWWLRVFCRLFVVLRLVWLVWWGWIGGGFLFCCIVGFGWWFWLFVLRCVLCGFVLVRCIRLCWFWWVVLFFCDVGLVCVGGWGGKYWFVVVWCFFVGGVGRFLVVWCGMVVWGFL